MKNEPCIPYFNGACLSLEFRPVSPLPRHGKRTHREVGHAALGTGTDCALLCAIGEIPRLAHSSLPRFVWFHVAVRLASRADLLGFGAVSPAAIRRSFRAAFHPGVFSCRSPCSGGPASSSSRAWTDFCVSRDAEHPCLLGVRAFVRSQHDFSWRGTAPAKPQGRRCGLATSTTGTTRSDEPIERISWPCFDRHRNGFGLRVH